MGAFEGVVETYHAAGHDYPVEIREHLADHNKLPETIHKAAILAFRQPGVAA